MRKHAIIICGVVFVVLMVVVSNLAFAYGHPQETIIFRPDGTMEICSPPDKKTGIIYCR